MKYYEIDENIARLSHQMMSMTDYREGSATAEYRATVDKAAALVEQKKQKVSPFYHEKLDALLDRYTRRLAEWTNAHNRNGASCPSVLVCGAGNFPTRKKHKQNARDEALWKEYQEIQGILNKIKSVGTGAIDLTDPHARELLTERVQALQAELDRGKAMNAHYRKYKTMQGFDGISPERAARMDMDLSAAPAFARTPCPSFELTSLRNRIKTAKVRLEELDKLEAQQASPAADTTFDGGRIVRNANENRLQIIFDDIPGNDTRSALKSHGFRWSPRNKAWQRQLTSNAEYDARKILGI